MRYRAKVDRETVAAMIDAVMNVPHQGRLSPEERAREAADAILPLFTLEVDAKRLGKVAMGLAHETYANYPDIARAVLEAAGLVRVETE